MSRRETVRTTAVARRCSVCGRVGIDVLPRFRSTPQRCFAGLGCNSFDGAQSMIAKLTARSS